MKLNIHALFVLMLLLCSLCASSQSYKDLYQQAQLDEDTLRQFQIIQQWEKATPNADDIDLYIAQFNYYFSIAKKEVVRFETSEQGGENFSLQVLDSVTEAIGYLNTEITFDPLRTKMAYMYIEKAKEKWPNRLDLYFGKIFAAGIQGNYSLFVLEIISVLNESKKNKCQWQWSDGPLKDAEDFVLSNVQAYQAQIWETNEDALLDDMLLIAEKMLELNPKCTEALSDAGIVYLSTNRIEVALNYFKKAEKIDKQDLIVLSNIATCYKRQGNVKMQAKYEKRIQKLEGKSKN
jgi:tetratricopeptide (TPR) repeat protein